MGEFLTVMQTPDFVSSLHNCLKFSQPLLCLYQAIVIQTQKTFPIAMALTKIQGSYAS